MTGSFPLLFLSLLPKDDDKWKGKPIALDTISKPTSLKIETAGRAYCAIMQAASSSDEKGEVEEPNEKNKEREESAALEKLKKKMSGKKVDLEDFYALLGLEEKKWDVTEEEVISSHRRVSLICHPDKAKSSERVYFETRYQAIQKAFEHLTDPIKKRNYDSSLPFNDVIPGSQEGTSAKGFFKSYRSVFKRNSRFSTEKPVPQLGDINTPYENVNTFYDFWFGFKSWRDFSYLDEHKLDDADSRDEKRWMERQNQKLRAAKKKEETARVRKLVEDAMKKDPRVIAEKKREEERKNQIKADKAEKRRQKELEIERIQQEEQRIKDEAAQLKKAEGQKQKKLRKKLKQARSTFRKLAKTDKLGKFVEADIELLCQKMQLVNMTALVEAFSVQNNHTCSGKEKKKAAALFKKHLTHAQVLQREEEKKAEEVLAKQKLASRKALEKIEKRTSVWTYEEETMLQKAIVKFPPGAGKRWQKIADMINSIGDKTCKEVIRKAKQTAYKKETSASAAFESYQKKVGRKKETLEKKHPGQLGAGTHNWDRTSSNKTSTKEKEKAFLKKAQESSVITEWTADQQFALEQALKTVPKGPDRWNNIAAAVKGKTKKEVIRRFKEIRARILAHKK